MISSNKTELEEALDYNPSDFLYEDKILENSIKDDSKVQLVMDTSSMPLNVESYKLRLKSARNCFDQIKVVNFTFELKMMPKLVEFPKK